MAGGGGYCTDSSGIIVYLRSLQGHAGRNLLILLYRNNVCFSEKLLFKVHCHVACAVNLHSITQFGSICGGQNLKKRQTVFFLLVDPMDKNKDPDTVDLNEPRHAQYMHKAWKRHPNPTYWVDINLSIGKGLIFYQIRSNAIILHETLPASLYSKSCQIDDWRSLKRRSIHVTSASTKDLIEARMDKRIGFGSCSTTRKDKLCDNPKFFQPAQPIPNPIRERSDATWKHTVSAKDDPESIS